MIKKALLAMTLVIAMQTVNAQMQQAVEQTASEFNLMGLSVVAVCDGRIAGQWYTGLRDQERDLPVNSNTKYRIASISKFVMTTAMMKLYDQKRLDLDEDVSNYLGFELRNPYHPEKPITVRMLLTHTSSINEGSKYDPFLMASYSNASNPLSFRELLLPDGSYYSSDTWKEEAPGEYFTYCNANFGLAGTIVERITGQRFEEFIQQNLFIPLGISGSYTAEGITDINNLAVIYRNVDGTWVPGTDNFKGVMSAPRDFSGYKTGTNAIVFSPQGGLRISASELARIMILHMNKGKYNGERIISRKSIRLMHRAHFISTDTNSDDEGVRKGDRGLSIQILPASASGTVLPEGSHFMGHSGSAYGLFADFYFDPKAKYGFILITNGIFDGPRAGVSGSFYTFEEKLIKALQENNFLPCKKNKR